MTIKRIAISIAVLLMGGLFAATAEAEPIDQRFAGSGFTTAVDTDGGFLAALTSGIIYENSPHRFRRRCEKMTA